ncbi:MAG TPA: ATP-binding cassette domain-containing protein, partial [Syntrophorhabdaceae bacterium]|nr:ATP-binding cassette domain-containing protein [Syntrophorhabdaceae bacterium]
MHRIEIIKEFFIVEEHIIEISNLYTSFFIDTQVIPVINNLNLCIKKGKVFGLIGESGSGKTMTALSILRLVPSPGRITGG